MYPKVVVDIKKLKENYTNMEKMFGEKGIEIYPVIKAVGGDMEVAKAMVDAGAKYLADSRIKNLKDFQKLGAKNVLLRIPMMSEIEDLVKYVDVSFNSEIEIIKLINDEAKKQNKVQDIIVMIDIGDLREGLYFKDDKSIEDAFSQMATLENINVLGLATNITCYGGVLPSNENLSGLVKIKAQAEKFLGKTMPLLSGGNSSSFELFLDGGFPDEITNLRMGEALLLGKETVTGETVNKDYKGAKFPLNDDVFILETEIVEMKTKDSLPTGKTGVNSFGEVPVINDKGEIVRAIVAFGKQDAQHAWIEPVDSNIEIIDSSSDHLILDLTKAKGYKLGSVVKFKLSYGSLVSTFTSRYVDIEYVNNK